jgi:hypothetical protein
VFTFDRRQFRGFPQSGQRAPSTPSILNKSAGDPIFKHMALRARLTVEETARISGHSTRVGAAQDMIRYGADMAGAMQAGRWKTPEMLARSTRRLNAKRGAVAKVAGLREQFA